MQAEKMLPEDFDVTAATPTSWSTPSTGSMPRPSPRRQRPRS